MYTLFISDLHLDANRPDLTEIFLRFLNTQALQADALYILGDFFAAWLGDDVQSVFTQTISTALNALTQTGVPVYLMHGNRDFLLGQRFLAESGCQLLPDPTMINLYGRKALLMHGDTLCWQDKAYLRFRKLARNRCLQRLFLSLPLSIRHRIARHLRQRSLHKDNALKTVQYTDATPAAILAAIKTYKVNILIHGHTHRPALERYYQPLPFTRIVLSDWETCGNALVCTPDQGLRLVYFS